METGGVLSLRKSWKVASVLSLEGGDWRCTESEEGQKASTAGRWTAGRWRCTESKEEPEGKCCWEVETGGLLNLRKSQKESAAGRWMYTAFEEEPEGKCCWKVEVY